MHKKPPHNPYEPSIRERLAQRDAAMSIHAYKVTGKRKYAVSKPVTYNVKKDLNSFYGYGTGGFSSYQKVGRILSGAKYQIIISDYLNNYPKPETQWLTEKQATMQRLKGFIVEPE